MIILLKLQLVMQFFLVSHLLRFIEHCLSIKLFVTIKQNNIRIVKLFVRK